MVSSDTRADGLMPKAWATRIEDLSPVGDELSEEQLRLVVGARRSNLTYCIEDSSPDSGGCARSDQIRD